MLLHETMADAISIASGIAGLVTLSAAVLAAGYRYVSSVSSASQDFRNLIRETASINAVLSQLVSHSLENQGGQRLDYCNLPQQDVLEDCEETLCNVQSLIRDCELVSRRGGKNVMNTLLWPIKKRDIVKHHERLSRLCASLHMLVSVGSADTLRTLVSGQRSGNEVVEELALNASIAQEQKILEWLSSLDHTAKHTTTMLLKQPGTHE